MNAYVMGGVLGLLGTVLWWGLGYGAEACQEASVRDGGGVATVTYVLPADPHYDYQVRLFYGSRDQKGMRQARSVVGDVGSVRSGGTIRWDLRGEGIGELAGVVERICVCYSKTRRANPRQVVIGVEGGWQFFGPDDLGRVWYDSTAARRDGVPQGWYAGIPLGCDWRLFGNDASVAVGVGASPSVSQLTWGVPGRSTWHLACLGWAYGLPADAHLRLMWSTPDSGTSYYCLYGRGWWRTWYNWTEVGHPERWGSGKPFERLELGIDWNYSVGVHVKYLRDRQERGVVCVGLVARVPHITSVQVR